MDAKLRKITLFLYRSDVTRMQSRYGYGWSVEVRNLVRQHLLACDRRTDEARGRLSDGE